MKSFALALVASLAAAETKTFEESYSGAAFITDIGTTDWTITLKTVIEETSEKLTTTVSTEVTWEAVLEGEDIAAGDEVEAWACFEGETCVIMRSVGTNDLSVWTTDDAGATLPASDCASANAQPSTALSSGLTRVAQWDGTTITAPGGADNPELVPTTVSITGKTVSMTAKTETPTVVDLAAIAEEAKKLEEELAKQQEQAEAIAEDAAA